MINSRITKALFIPFVFFLSLSLFGESVFIKDGSILQGEIVKESDKSIILKMPKGQRKTIPRKQVLRIIYNDEYKNKVNLLLKNDEVVHGHIVDENKTDYVIRTRLLSPKEIRVSKKDVEGIINTNAVKRLLSEKESASSVDNEEKGYKIGDRGPAGGWVFYDKGKFSDGWQYLEAAPEDLKIPVRWGCDGKLIPGADGKKIGHGRINTEVIVKNCGETDTAAVLCTKYQGGGHNDWFLPSENELSLMYKNLQQRGLGSFSNENYWSSSQANAFHAIVQGFSYISSVTGRADFSSASFEEKKNKSFYVRAVRAF